jgi:hypothetical protein
MHARCSDAHGDWLRVYNASADAEGGSIMRLRERRPDPRTLSIYTYPLLQ